MFKINLSMNYGHFPIINPKFTHYKDGKSHPLFSNIKWAQPKKKNMASKRSNLGTWSNLSKKISESSNNGNISQKFIIYKVRQKGSLPSNQEVRL